MKAVRIAALFAVLCGPLVSSPADPRTPPAPAPRQLTAIVCGRVYTVSGAVLDRAVILVENGTIVDVVPGTRAPEGAKVIDASNQVVVPGLVDAATWLVDGGAGAESISPHVRAADGVDPFHGNRWVVTSGVTTVYLAPGQGRLIGGRGAVVKTSGRERILRETYGLHASLGPSAKNPPPLYKPPILPSADNPILPARRQGSSSRMGQFAELRRAFEEVRKTNGKADRRNGWTSEKIDAFAPVLSKKEPLLVACLTADDIVKTVLFAESSAIRVVLLHATEAYKVADFLAERKIPVVLHWPYFPRGGWRADEERPAGEATPDLRAASALVKAGVPTALHAPGFGDRTDLLFVAGSAVRWGLTEEAALRAVTLTPAEILGVADRVGSIEKGKHADLVFLNADPFQAAAATQRVMVDGEFVFERKPADNRTYDVARSDAARAKERDVLAIKAGRILSVTQGVIQDGLILVENGKITYVGRGQMIPKHAKVLDASRDVVAPGMIDLNSHLGFHADQGEASRLSGGWSDGTPQQLVVPASKLVRLDDPCFRDAASGGITSILLTPRFQGACSVIKLHGGKDAVVREIGAFKFMAAGGTQGAEQMRQFLARAKKYHEEWEAYERSLKEKKEPPKTETTGPEKKPDPISGTWKGTMEIPDYNMKVEFTAELKLEGAKVTGSLTTETMGQIQTEPVEGTFANNELKVTGEQRGAKYEITMRLEGPNHLKGKWKVSMQGMEMSGPVECRRVAGGEGQAASTGDKPQDKKEPRRDETLDPLRPLFRREIPALVEARDYATIETSLKIFRDEFNLDFVLLGANDAVHMGEKLFQKVASAAFGADFLVDKRGAWINLAEALASSGVPVAFYSDLSSGTKLLPYTASYAVRYGLDPFDGLKALTLNPARMLGLMGRIGSIERGADADLLILSGEPFDLSTRVKKVLINGKTVHGE